MGGVAGSAGDLAIFERHIARHAHAGRERYAGAMPVLEPDRAAGIADRSIVAAQAVVGLGDDRLAGGFQKREIVGAVGLAGPFEVADGAGLVRAGAAVAQPGPTRQADERAKAECDWNGPSHHGASF